MKEYVGLDKNNKRKGSQIANIITSIRILISIALLFYPAFSQMFYTLYLIGGITDIIDGIIARKTNSVSDFGSKLDTIADFIFFTVCLIKLIPKINIPVWLYIWIAVIALLKLSSITYGYIVYKEFLAYHNIMNKITGLLLFIFPLVLSFFELKINAIFICLVATFAALQEGYYIIIEKPKISI